MRVLHNSNLHDMDNELARAPRKAGKLSVTYTWSWVQDLSFSAE